MQSVRGVHYKSLIYLKTRGYTPMFCLFLVQFFVEYLMDVCSLCNERARWG